MTDLPAPPSDLDDLRRLSARIGADPLLIQAAGGNTSVKDGGVIWIKASGTLLAEAEAREIFVATDLEAMRAALGDPDAADNTAAFLLPGQSLRPSIETSLHAVFRQRIVVHVHCVQTLAAAVRRDAETVLSSRLQAFDWSLAPYTKPGARLAARVAETMGPGTDVVVLRNHGLIVAADTVAAADALLGRVTAALRVEPAAPGVVDMGALQAAAEPGWQAPPHESPVHQLALHPGRVAQARGGSLYPDHVIFCGSAAEVTDGDPSMADTPGSVIRILPGKGVLLPDDASEGATALARCLGDVLLRVPPDAALTYLSPQDEAVLLDWDAEKYRKALND